MLRIHTAGRIETLVDRLAHNLSRPPGDLTDDTWDPFAPEWIAVPSEGMRRWLNLELAARLGSSDGRCDGVTANVVGAHPSSLRTAVLGSEPPGAVTSAGGRAADDPWRIESLTWSVMAELRGAVASESSTATDEQIRRVGTPPEGVSLWARARRIAELFDRYHIHRVDMIRSWLLGDDVDGTGHRLDAQHSWQPELWRRVADRVGATSPPTRLIDQMDRLLRGELSLELPPRLVVFGLSVLPGGVGFVDLAQAVGASRDVQMYMVEPSPVASLRISESIGPPPESARLRADDRTWELVGHPLLRSWGRLQRESTVLIADSQRQGLRDVIRLEDDYASGLHRATMLGRLQSDLRNDSPPIADMAPGADDQTIRIHSAHGVARQVEVLRDVLLHLLDDEVLDLTEDDIIVMSPAIEQMAPVIHSVLGPSSDGAHRPGSTPALRYRIGDRSLRQAVPILEVLERTMSLVSGRFDAVSVLDLVATAAVRHRFGFSDDDVALITDWVTATRVRWGLDEHHREFDGIPAEFDTNTWRAAVDRLMLGCAIGDGSQLAVGDAVPLPVEGSDSLLAGRLAELLWRLEQLHGQVSAARPIGDWVSVLRDAADALFAVPDAESWQRDSLAKVLSSLEEGAADEPAAADMAIDFLDLRRAVAAAVGGVSGRADFYRGGITFASMSSMRGVPHRVVVLLGMDQPAFSVQAPDGDDLAAASPLLGDRDPRGESRQALLDAVMSARDRLVLIREGRDIRTNHEVPRAVPVAELVDAVLASVDPDQRASVERILETEHPRQAFDESSFQPGVHIAGPWSFDAVAHRGAISRRERRATSATLLTTPLPSEPEPVVELSDLHALLKDPSNHFARRRLGVQFPSKEESPSVVVPLDIVGLERYEVGDRLLAWLLSGAQFDDWVKVERRLGTLGPGSLGDTTLDEVRTTAGSIIAAARELGVGTESHPIEVDLVVQSGERVVGLVEDRLDGEPGPIQITYSSERPAQWLRIWLDLLICTLVDPSRPWRAVSVAKHPAKNEAVTTELRIRGSGVERERHAASALDVVLDLHRRGAVGPLPLFPAVSHALWVNESPAPHWARFPAGGDGATDAVQLLYGGHDLRSLLALPRLDGDPVTASGPEAGRLQCFAEYLWDTFDGSTVRTTDSSAPDEGQER